jgi:hypothetical protein
VLHAVEAEDRLVRTSRPKSSSIALLGMRMSPQWTARWGARERIFPDPLAAPLSREGPVSPAALDVHKVESGDGTVALQRGLRPDLQIGSREAGPSTEGPLVGVAVLAMPTTRLGLGVKIAPVLIISGGTVVNTRVKLLDNNVAGNAMVPTHRHAGNPTLSMPCMSPAASDMM